MRRQVERGGDEARETAVAAAWGFVHSRQWDHALAVARGALLVWPEDVRLRLLETWSAMECGLPVQLRLGDYPGDGAWAPLLQTLQVRLALQADHGGGPR
ncbi:hypothetical protein OOT46_03800 [Aquabacterium sp. A7-Y]|uniref:hypothetical protein n=1 Tax=Aquabacterium sp. A7-Y TaxID=1349605 RepID=UPI00223D160F|nr:hypothetical protein [Aquabacterium sp. A7-Y]MCW7536977.1 hypothetical protein [Aquabacterium sp. A7-Y]